MRNFAISSLLPPTRLIVAFVLTLGATASLAACTHRTILTDMQANGLSRFAKLTGPAATKVWFVREEKGKMDLVPVKRKIQGDNKLECAVRALLDGPSLDEIKDGLGSEIPRGTILLSVNDKNGKVELNLSRRFALEGGVDSVETRLMQLTKTVISASTQQAVFLDIEGQRLTTTPGEGLEVKQPINR